MKRITKAQDLVDGHTYSAHYIDNMKTKVSHQYAVVPGETAKQMLIVSTNPERIFFIKEQ
jgi:hypothetical protein